MNETKALGMIEVYGRVADVEALDAALKAADTSLVSLSKVGGGLTTIFVEGEVAAVKASVEAGGAAAARVGTLISTHVIPRPDPSVREMLRRDIQIPPSGTSPDGSNGPNGSVVPPDPEAPAPAPAEAKAAPAPAAPAPATTPAAAPVTAEDAVFALTSVPLLKTFRKGNFLLGRAFAIAIARALWKAAALAVLVESPTTDATTVIVSLAS